MQHGPVSICMGGDVDQGGVPKRATGKKDGGTLEGEGERQGVSGSRAERFGGTNAGGVAVALLLRLSVLSGGRARDVMDVSVGFLVWTLEENMWAPVLKFHLHSVKPTRAVAKPALK